MASDTELTVRIIAQGADAVVASLDRVRDAALRTGAAGTGSLDKTLAATGQAAKETAPKLSSVATSATQIATSATAAKTALVDTAAPMGRMLNLLGGGGASSQPSALSRLFGGGASGDVASFLAAAKQASGGIGGTGQEADQAAEKLRGLGSAAREGAAGTQEVREAIHAFGIVADEAGVSIGHLYALSRLAAGGFTLIGGVIAGTIIASLERMAEAAATAQSRIEALGGSWDKLGQVAGGLGSRPETIAPVFEQLQRLQSRAAPLDQIAGQATSPYAGAGGLGGVDVNAAGQSLLDALTAERLSLQEAVPAASAFVKSLHDHLALTPEAVDQLSDIAPHYGEQLSKELLTKLPQMLSLSAQQVQELVRQNPAWSPLHFLGNEPLRAEGESNVDALKRAIEALGVGGFKVSPGTVLGQLQADAPGNAQAAAAVVTMSQAFQKAKAAALNVADAFGSLRGVAGFVSNFAIGLDTIAEIIRRIKRDLGIAEPEKKKSEASASGPAVPKESALTLPYDAEKLPSGAQPGGRFGPDVRPGHQGDVWYYGPDGKATKADAYKAPPTAVTPAPTALPSPLKQVEQSTANRMVDVLEGGKLPGVLGKIEDAFGYQPGEGDSLYRYLKVSGLIGSTEGAQKIIDQTDKVFAAPPGSAERGEALKNLSPAADTAVKVLFSFADSVAGIIARINSLNLPVEGTSGNANAPTPPQGRRRGGLIGFLEGGPIVGRGTGTSDSIPAMLDQGGFVVNAESTAAVGHSALAWFAAMAGGGEVPALVSNGEYYFTPRQAAGKTGMLNAINGMRRGGLLFAGGGPIAGRRFAGGGDLWSSIAHYAGGGITVNNTAAPTTPSPHSVVNLTIGENTYAMQASPDVADSLRTLSIEQQTARGQNPPSWMR